MKEKLKISKQISILLILILIIQLFMPWLNFKSYAGYEAPTPPAFVFKKHEMQDDGTNKYFVIDVAQVGDWYCNSIDIKFGFDKTKIEPARKDTHVASTNLKNALEGGDSSHNITYQSTTSYYDKTASTIRVIPNMSSADTETPADYDNYLRIFSIYFRLVDTNLTDNDITEDFFKFVPTNGTNGLKFGYVKSDGKPDYIIDTSYMKFDGFAESEKNVSSISVKTNPTNSTEHGNAIDLTGGKLHVIYDDNSEEDIDMTDERVSISSPTDKLANIDNTEITLNFRGKSVKVNINVTDPMIDFTVKTPMTVTNYNHNIPFDFTNLTFDAETKSGKHTTVNLSEVSKSEETASVDSPKFTQVTIDEHGVKKGTQEIIFTYTKDGVTKTANQIVSVNDTITGVRVNTQPNKKVYKRGENLDLSGATIIVTLASSGDGTPIAIPSGAVTGYSNTTTGQMQSLPVKLGDITATGTINVEVYNNVKSSTITPPSDIEVQHGGQIKLAGGKIEITFADNSKKQVNLSECTITGLKNTTVGEQEITAEYTVEHTLSIGDKITEKVTKTFYIEVVNPITSIAITAPSKTEYKHGEALATDGTITVTFADKSTATRTMTKAMIFEENGTTQASTSPTTYDTTNKVSKNLKIKYTEDEKTETINYPITIINTVKSVAVHGNPKTTYNVNDPIYENLEILVTREVGTPSPVKVTSGMIDKFDTTTEGSKTTTITYVENGVTKTATYNYTVADKVKNLTIKTAPVEKQKYGEELDLTGATVEVVKGSKTETIPIKKEMIKAGTYDKEQLGEQTVTIEYGTKEDGTPATATFKVNVKDYVTGITIDPSSITGKYNTELSKLLEDGKVKYTVTYAEKGAQTPVALDSSMVAGYNKETTQTQNLTVTYTDNDTNSYTNGEDKTATLTINLSNTVSSIEITAPSKTEYKHGETLATDGTITVTFADNSTATRTMTKAMIFEENGTTQASTSPTTYDTTNKVSKNLKIKYTEDEKTETINYPITIINTVKSIAVHGNPKTTYNVNDPIYENLEILVTREVGTPSPVKVTSDMISGFDTTTEGSRGATITYVENGVTKTATYNYTVADKVKNLTIKTAPVEKQKYGEELDLTGATVEVVKGSKTETIPIKKEMIKAGTYDKEQLGEQTVTIEYGTKEDGTPATATFKVNVKDYVTGITIDPSSITGKYNTELPKLLEDKKVKYTVTYAEKGAQTPVALDSSMVAGYNKETTQTQNLTVTYTDNDVNSYTNGKNKTATLTINLSNTVSSIAITAPSKTEYKHGEALATDGTITVTFADNSTATRTMTKAMIFEENGTTQASTSPTTYDTTNKVSKNLKIKYTEDEKTETINYPITIINTVKSIAVHGNPKTTYNVNDPIYENLEILVTREVGTASPVKVTSGMIDKFDTTTEGSKTTIITYVENGVTKTTNYAYTVTDSISGIDLIGTPKDKYIYGEEFKISDLELVIHKSSGDQTIPVTEDMIKNYNKNQEGDQTVTIEYNGQVIKTISVNVANPVQKIEWLQKPKTSYTIGDTLNVTGGKIQATKADKSTVTIDLEESMISNGFDTTTTGNKTVTVTYEGFNLTYDITVVDKVSSIAIKTQPKKDYLYNQELQPGGQIEVTKGNGEKETINITPDMISGYNPKKLGDQTVTITYGGATTTFDLVVSDYVQSVVITPPSKISYKYGESLNLSDAVITKVMASTPDSPITIPVTSAMISGYTATNVGPQTVTITYTDDKVYTQKFAVEVKDEINNITLENTGFKTQYLYNENINPNGLNLKVQYDSGKIENVAVTTGMILNYKPQTLGNQTITVKYKDFTQALQVNVKDYLKDITLTPPTKYEYKIGETLKLDGGSITENMASGAKGNKVVLTPSMLNGFDSTTPGTKNITVTYGKFTKQFQVVVYNTVNRIEVISPTKTNYKYGESLNLAGGSIKLIMEDGTTSTKPLTNNMVKGYQKTTPGQQILTVTYIDEKGNTHLGHFKVTVGEDYIKEEKFIAPSKKSYKIGDTIDLTGGSITEVYASGKLGNKYNITSSMISGFDSTTPGTKTIKVNHNGKVYTYNVNVIDQILGISIKTLPNKLQYNQGENLDVTGATLNVVKQSGIYVVTITNNMITGYNANKEGMQAVTVNYQGFTAQFSVKVNEKKKDVNSSETKTNNSRPGQNNAKSSNNTNSVRIIRQVQQTETPVQEAITEESTSDTLETPNSKEQETVNSETPDTQKPRRNNKPTETLGVKEEKEDEPNNKKIIASIIGGAGLLLMLLLVCFKRNVKIYVEEEGKFALAGLDKITSKKLKLNIDKYLDKETYESKVKIHLNDSISEKLDGKEIEITHRGKVQTYKIKYKDAPYEIILK